MLPSSGRKNICNCHKKLTTSPSLSSSSSSSSSTSSPSQVSANSPLLVPTPTGGGSCGGRTMEEVWKDINLSSLQTHPGPTGIPCGTHHRHSHSNPNSIRPTILQDFLARPFAAAGAGNRHSSVAPAEALFGSPPPPPPPPPPAAPATALSLNSGPEFQFLDGSDDAPLRRQQLPVQCGAPALNANISDVSPLDVMASSGFGLPFGNKKRFPDFDGGSGEFSGGDRRHKRMIKNRESAARSRARKQAYTNELEREVAHLMEENARLKRQQQQLRTAAASQATKKQTLHRTSTAPF